MNAMRRMLLLATALMGASLTWGAPEAEASARAICGHVCVSSCGVAESECAAMGCQVLWCGGTSDTCFGPNQWAGCGPL